MNRQERQRMIRILNALPLSELLRVAVADLRRAMRDPNLVLNMSYWVKPKVVFRDDPQGRLVRHEICAVCMAGAVLYCKLEERDEGQDLPVFADRLNTMRLGGLPNGDWSPNRQRISLDARARFNRIVSETYDIKRDGGRALLPTYLKAATYLESQGL